MKTSDFNSNYVFCSLSKSLNLSPRLGLLECRYSVCSWVTDVGFGVLSIFCVNVINGCALSVIYCFEHLFHVNKYNKLFIYLFVCVC